MVYTGCNYISSLAIFLSSSLVVDRNIQTTDILLSNSFFSALHFCLAAQRFSSLCPCLFAAPDALSVCVCLGVCTLCCVVCGLGLHSKVMAQAALTQFLRSVGDACNRYSPVLLGFTGGSGAFTHTSACVGLLYVCVRWMGWMGTQARWTHVTNCVGHEEPACQAN